MQWKQIILVFAIACALSCCTYNPFAANNHTTGNPAAAIAGAGAGAGVVALAGGSKPFMVLGGIVGGAVGYYITTLRFDSGGVIQSGGQVYQLGEFVGIEIPADKLFEPNTADLLPQSSPILDSAAAVLKRYPNNNILISGNTSGFGMRKWEQKLSEQRAQKVAAYLWNAGVTQFKDKSLDLRKLTYVGYGDFFPITSKDTNDGIRENSRIQITSYPSSADLHLDKCHKTFENMGAYKDDVLPDKCDKTKSDCCDEK